MKTIKFRGKSKESNEWVYGFYYEIPAPLKCIGKQDDPKGYIVMKNPNAVNDWGMPIQMVAVEVDKETVCQYTGLKDIKGIEVYGGDIIPFHLDSNVKGVVKFGEYTDWNCKRPTQHIGFYVDFTGEHKRINRKDLGYWVEVSYVIGNIYDNQELLK